MLAFTLEHLPREPGIIVYVYFYFSQVLWPDGLFFLRARNAESNGNESEFGLKSFQGAGQFGGGKVCKPGSFEEQLEAARRASDVRKMLFGE